MLSRIVRIALLLAVALGARQASAAGLLIPDESSLPPLQVKSLRVEADVEDGVATTHVDQTFLNNTNRRMEATYIFPLPQDAAVTDFAMMINGKRQSGELVPADKARRIYQDIVRRVKDPGLLEYMDSGLLRLRVFPIEPKSDVKLEVSYTHQVPFESGVYEYVFPLKTEQKASTVRDDLTVTVRIAARTPIKSVYSPTHEVGVSRKDDRHAVAGFEKNNVTLSEDFRLFYGLSDEEFGLNLLTHRLEGQDGYFALMISPRYMKEDSGMPKDVCFVMDTSGSMQQQDRISSAKKAARFCVQSLARHDRFQFITFSSGVESHTDGLVRATSRNVEKVVDAIDDVEARGGTDLAGGLLKALEHKPGDRPYMIVLLTDGEPTVGITEPDKIVQQVKDANASGTRVFTFGISENLDVTLLDRIAEVTRGYPQYVQPGRDMEQRLSAFYRKISSPVLANLSLDYGSVKVRDQQPTELPDLFRGSQLVVFGRYTETGSTAVRLTGTVDGERRTFSYDARFPRAESGNAFIPQLWAQRQIAFLLDQIRLHGESDELKNEVVRLSKEHGIATPYTSYLVLENEEAYEQHNIVRRGAMERLRSMDLSMGAASGTAPQAEDDAEVLDEYKTTLEEPARAPAGGKIRAGEALRSTRSVNTTEGLKRGGAVRAGRTRRVGSRTMLQHRGTWIDTAFQEDMKVLEVKFGSDAYFALFDALPEDARDALKLGNTMVLVVNERAVMVSGKGQEEMREQEIREFLQL